MTCLPANIPKIALVPRILPLIIISSATLQQRQQILPNPTPHISHSRPIPIIKPCSQRLPNTFTLAKCLTTIITCRKTCTGKGKWYPQIMIPSGTNKPIAPDSSLGTSTKQATHLTFHDEIPWWVSCASAVALFLALSTFKHFPAGQMSDILQM